MAEICSRLGYEETELRLGLSTKISFNFNGKRGYETDDDDVDLKLNLSNSKVICNADTYNYYYNIYNQSFIF